MGSSNIHAAEKERWRPVRAPQSHPKWRGRGAALPALVRCPKGWPRSRGADARGFFVCSGACNAGRTPPRTPKTTAMCGSELHSLPDGVQRVARVLQDAGHPHAPRMLDDACRTAQLAADALGIAVGQIAKSIIFRRKSDEVAVLVITSGDRRVDEKKVDAIVGKTGRADADFVKARTGFTIGGVSPVGHVTKPVVLIDRELFRFEEIWAAAGHPHAVFQLRPHDLETLTGAPVADVVVAAA